MRKQFKQGDSVHYIPYKECDPSEYQNGIVKSEHFSHPGKMFVVYHCGGEWGHYMHYTACLTNISDLREGWVTLTK